MVKFAHLADCHVGGWSDLRLKELSMQVFTKTIDTCIERQVDFILISGDLFNTALPSIDILKQVALEFNRLKENNISCYIIPGSHDYSPSGKTMLDVLENSGLVTNVAKYEEVEGKIKLKFTVDEKTGVLITGLFGKIGGLEKNYYKNLDKTSLEEKQGKKIFMFHTTLTEFKPRELEMVSSESLEILPKKFDYYAGGHVHFIFNELVENYGRIVYPGALFPNSFSELEKFENGGFFINEFVDNDIKSEYIPVKLKSVNKYPVDLTGKDSSEVKDFILDKIDKNEVIDSIVLIRLKGILESGKLSDINFRSLFEELKNSFVILKNSSELKIKEFEELESIEENVENVEDVLISKHSENVKLIKSLIESLDKEKLEGEKNLDFEERIIKEAVRVLKLE